MYGLGLLAALQFVAPHVAQGLAIPSASGTVWRYSGTARWTLPNSTVVRSGRVDWQATVVYSRKSAEATVVVIRGFPTDLAWYEPGKQPGLMILTSRPDGLYLREVAQEAQAQEIADSILAGSDPGDRILRGAPEVGDCLGADPERDDGMYCWRVERRVQYQGHPGWSLAYRANPDLQTIEIVPGVGITAYAYEHHGTVASVSVRLRVLTESHEPAEP